MCTLYEMYCRYCRRPGRRELDPCRTQTQPNWLDIGPCGPLPGPCAAGLRRVRALPEGFCAACTAEMQLANDAHRMSDGDRLMIMRFLREHLDQHYPPWA